MKKLFGALAIVMLALTVNAPQAEARCWWNGFRWVCNYYRPYVRHWHPYRPYVYTYRPYYRPHYYRPRPYW